MKKQSRAFLGFKKKVDFNPEKWVDMATTFVSFWTDWRSGLTLSQCLQRAQAPNLAYRFDASAVIYGATNMTMNGN